MKKILVLTNIYPAPDVERGNTPVVHYFTKEWEKMGYEVRVINYPANFPKLMMWIATLFKKQLSSRLGATIRTYQLGEIPYEIDNVPVMRIPLLKRKLHGAYSRRAIDAAYTKTLRYLKSVSFSPDLIISHWVNPQLEIMNRLKKEYHCRTCYVAHLATAELDAIYSRERSQQLIDDIDVIGFRSSYIKTQFFKAFTFSGSTFQCYSGIPEKYVSQKPVVRTFENLNRFIYVGTLIRRKFPAEIIPALVGAYGDEEFCMSYIGTGSEQKQIEAYAKKANVEDKVNLLGFIPRDKVVEKMCSSDIFIMISRNEAFGLVYLEAMAMGLITIASKKEGFDGIIVHGKNGFLCEAGNVTELTNLIKEIRNMEPVQLQQISRNAMETASNLTDTKAARLYMNAISDAIN